MNVQDTFCRHCGHNLYAGGTDTTDGGRRCNNCSQVVYENQIAVAILIAPCGNHQSGNPHGVFAGRRAYGRFKGQLCLPGGFVMKGESWQAAACREANEELGLVCRYKHSSFETPVEHMVRSTPDGAETLIFGRVSGVFLIKAFEPNNEVLERVELFPDTAEQLCFPLHREALAKYWAQLGVEHQVAA